MNTNQSETKALAVAVENLASIVVNVIEARIRTSESMLEQKLATKTLQPIVSKTEAAKYFNVSTRTIDSWMKCGYLPYFKIGRCVRIPISDAQDWFRERHLVRLRA